MHSDISIIAHLNISAVLLLAADTMASTWEQNADESKSL
jgi:hypothetical protein